MLKNNSRQLFGARLSSPDLPAKQYHALRKIAYDHIPGYYYHFADQVTVLKFDLATRGNVSVIFQVPETGCRKRSNKWGMKWLL